MKKLYIVICTLACCLTACKPTITPNAPTAGTADFSRFMIVGDSYSSGFADGSLYKSGQENSLAVMLATQFKLAGGGDFKQPMVVNDNGLPHPRKVLAMATGCDGIPSLAPVDGPKGDTTADYAGITAQEPFNNIATPGMRAADFLLEDYISTLNQIKPGELPYAKRFYHNQHYSPLEELQYTRDAIKPTFFTMWLGFFDVFLYAQSGGIGSANPPGGDPGVTDITGIEIFEARYDSALQNMVKSGAKGVVINVPDILDMPYFTTIPLNDNNGTRFNMKDGVTTRKIADGEFLLLEMPIDSLKCYGMGISFPIPGRWVLSANEVTNVRNAIVNYNDFIKKEADKYGLAFVDINTYLKSIDPGVIFNGVTYGPKFVQGGAYSLDGLHFTPRGYALVANQVISVINSKYGSTLPQVDVNKYKGVQFP